MSLTPLIQKIWFKPALEIQYILKHGPTLFHSEMCHIVEVIHCDFEAQRWITVLFSVAVRKVTSEKKHCFNSIWLKNSPEHTHSHSGCKLIQSLLSTHRLGVYYLEVTNWTCLIRQCVVELVTQGSTAPSTKKTPSHPQLLSALISIVLLHILCCA